MNIAPARKFVYSRAKRVVRGHRQTKRASGSCAENSRDFKWQTERQPHLGPHDASKQHAEKTAAENGIEPKRREMWRPHFHAALPKELIDRWSVVSRPNI